MTQQNPSFVRKAAKMFVGAGIAFVGTLAASYFGNPELADTVTETAHTLGLADFLTAGLVSGATALGIYVPRNAS